MNLIINSNNVAGAQGVNVRYRILGSGDTFKQIALQPSQLPYTVVGVPTGEYEIGVQAVCTNGAVSEWVSGQTTSCATPVSLTVTLGSGVFNVAAQLSGLQTMIEIQMTDPNGGTQTIRHDFGAQSGSFTIPVLPATYGNYTFVGRAICDVSATPVYASATLDPIVVDVANPAPVDQVLKFVNDGSTPLTISAVIIDGNYQTGGQVIPATNSASPFVMPLPYTGGVHSIIKVVLSGYAIAHAQIQTGSSPTRDGSVTGSGMLTTTFTEVDLSAASTQNITYTS